MNQATAWLPYCGIAPLPDTLAVRWNGDPILLAALLLAALAFYRRPGASASQRQAFAAALALCLLLFVSPLCALTSALFAARTVHHVLLTALVAPLLAIALASTVRPPRGGLALWTVAHTLAFWVWHAPPAYAWALSSNAAYWLMQASLLVTAWGMWAHIRTAPMPIGIAAQAKLVSSTF